MIGLAAPFPKIGTLMFNTSSVELSAEARLLDDVAGDRVISTFHFLCYMVAVSITTINGPTESSW